MRLNPVAAESDPSAASADRARLLRAAYLDALSQVRAMAADTPPSYPAELPNPIAHSCLSPCLSPPVEPC